jgi:dTDP-4-dehydrorhamnose 3,5-epimerase
VSVVKGRILDVAVDIRKNSKFYGQSFSIELDDKTNKQLFIPKGFAHGFVVLSKTARVSYKVDNYYNPKSERGLNYNDPLLEIDWKIDKKSIITNEKDNNYSSFDSEFFFE